VTCGDLLGYPTRDQLAQHCVQPAGDLGPGPVQVTVTLRPHLQHRRVIARSDFPAGRRAQRRNSDRPCVVRVVLAHRPSGQQPHPGAQLGPDIQHLLTRSQEMLGQQIPQTPAPSTAQVRSGQAAAHASSRCAWAAEARTRSSPSGSSAAPIATLMRIHPDHHYRHEQPSHRHTCDRGGHALFQDLTASRLFRATPRQGPDRLARR
jgi:hypothetical protein